jgi:hypothetical protein
VIDFIPIITGFAFIDSTIAAHLRGAAGRTAITDGFIAVVAFLKTRLFWLQITPVNAITAAR